MPLSNVPFRMDRSPVLRYGLAIVSVLGALGIGLLAQHYNYRKAQFTPFIFAVAITGWYGGSGPAALSVALSIPTFAFFFGSPIYSVYAFVSELPSFIAFACSASLAAWFSAVRRRVEAYLREARDRLQAEVEERTRQASLLNLTHDSIFVRDANDIISYWNRGAQEFYGWTTEEAIGERSHELLHTVLPAPVEEINRELLATGRWEGELRQTKADGREVVVSSRWSLTRDAGGRRLATLVTNNDITERKRREDQIRGLNEELAKRSAELEATNKELEAFAYSVSHDLRAPLRHMSGYAELLQKKAYSVLDDKSQRYLAMIMESAKRMGNLIDDLLAFSRIGRADTQKTLINLDQLLREVQNEMRQETEGRIVDWKIGALPVCYGDRSMLKLVLANLLSNALKFTRNRPRAEIEIGCARENKEEVAVFVRDNGAGFDMKYVHKLFGVFQRLHQSEAFEGTGIGLATVQRIIHRHGGSVRAEGAVDEGATFYFSVPNVDPR